MSRAFSPGLDDLLDQKLPVLVDGFIRVVDYMGNDASVVQAARVSYGTGTKTVSDDRQLIRYLMRHFHTTPFEMAEIKLHVKLPIFVARQWIRHRTASVNEYSARYSILDKEFYVPEIEHIHSQSETNKQGRGDLLPGEDSARITEVLRREASRAFDTYDWLLADHDSSGESKRGISRELARINLPLSSYTQWYWKADLHNFMNFLRLRADPHAQYEIRAYAQQMLEILKLWVPETYEAFCEYRLEAITLSRSAKRMLKRMIAGESITFKNSGLSKREYDEVCSSMELD